MPNKFDRVIQENIQALTKSLVHRIMNIPEVEVVRLPRKMHRTMEREVDSLLQIKKAAGEAALLNVEWQADNDPDMCLRMLLYHAHSALAYRLPVLGVVVYIGRNKVDMPVVLDYENLRYHYRLIDLTELSPETFLESDVPEEIIMAVLAGKTRYEQKREVIRKILNKLRTLLQDDSGALNRKIGQLEIIGELRNVQKIILEEETKMALTYNIERDIRYNQGLEKGLEKGIEKGIEKGLEKGIEKATADRNAAFVKSLLQHTAHSTEEIAQLVGVPIEFVSKVKADLGLPA